MIATPLSDAEVARLRAEFDAMAPWISDGMFVEATPDDVRARWMRLAASPGLFAGLLDALAQRDARIAGLATENARTRREGVFPLPRNDGGSTRSRRPEDVPCDHPVRCTVHGDLHTPPSGSL